MDRLIRSLIVGLAAFTIDYLANEISNQAKAHVNNLLLEGRRMDEYDEDVLEEMR